MWALRKEFGCLDTLSVWAVGEGEGEGKRRGGRRRGRGGEGGQEGEEDDAEESFIWIFPIKTFICFLRLFSERQNLKMCFMFSS